MFSMRTIGSFPLKKPHLAQYAVALQTITVSVHIDRGGSFMAKPGLLEILAPVNLRKALELKDGMEVEATVGWSRKAAIPF